MKAKFVHRCTHVLDKEATIKFYEEALGMKVLREMGLKTARGPIRSWAMTVCPSKSNSPGTADALSPTRTAAKDTHIAFVVDDFDAAHELHEKRWAALFARTLAWAFISSPIPRASGLRFCLPAKA